MNAQILDDTSQVVYGPYTSYFNYFTDFKFDNYDYRPLDTLYEHFHAWEFVKKEDYYIQDLGNLGTATFPIFYRPDDRIGVQAGFNAYRHYYYEAGDIEYFDTKSPYTNVRADFGNGKRNLTTVDHAQNITPYWNAGFTFRTISSLKQVAARNSSDRQVNSTAYSFHTHYQSPNGKFAVLGHISRIFHRVKENGGISLPDSALISDYFAETAKVNLQNAESSDLYINSLIYTEYKIVPQFQIYYSFLPELNKYQFIDEDLDVKNGDGEFFDQILINADSTTNRAQFNSNTHEIGLKGDQSGFYYNFYIKLRNYKYLHTYLKDDDSDFEGYGGFYFRFKNKKKQFIDLFGEYILGNTYKLGGTIYSDYLNVKAVSQSNAPSIIQNKMFQNHGEWYNNFDPVFTNMIEGSITLPYQDMYFTPKAMFANVTNYIYWDRDRLPAQANGNAQILELGLEAKFRFFKHLYLEADVVYTNVGGDGTSADAFRIPKWFGTGRLYFSRTALKSFFHFNVGIEGHIKSDYFANDYDPVMQQFYLQDDFIIPSYMPFDLFFNFQIDHFTAFVKWQHFNQGNGTGYFTAPRYIGQAKGIDLGIRWMFFD